MAAPVRIATAVQINQSYSPDDANVDPFLTGLRGSLGPLECAFQAASRSVRPICARPIRVPKRHDRQTMKSATSVAITRIQRSASDAA